MMEKPKKVSVCNLFVDANYIIPIYQRNYSWESLQIEQLIDDINNISDDGKENYFLGNLVVNKSDRDTYQVIDGQQRLTTIYIIASYLKFILHKNALRFEAREKSNKTLESLTLEKKLQHDGYSDEMILSGYKTVENHFKSAKIDEKVFTNKLNNIFILRVEVPEKTDLNHYFEVMNTRGEQLDLHEIVKAKLLSKLSSEDEKHTANLIWEACSNMDSYVQMNFDINIRKNIFSRDWSDVCSSISDFNSINRKTKKENKGENTNSLVDILKKHRNGRPVYKNKTGKEESERFESIITFPYLLLHVNSSINQLKNKDQELIENEYNLNDKNLIENLSSNWVNEKSAKNFIFYLLKCRVIFDKYILKREFTKDYKTTGNWSLQKLKSEKKQPIYVGTFLDDKNQQVRTLQSCLRITYTSPKTMHWITLVISAILDDPKENLIFLLEDYCIQKIYDSEYQEKSGFGFERIVFTYLDYLLYRDGYKKIIKPLNNSWQFQFRNSIEHFYPQNPHEIKQWDTRVLNDFGNLALITATGNSKFSNLSPRGKVSTYTSIIEQSLKLKIMAKMESSSEQGWDSKDAQKHGIDMFNILTKEMDKYTFN